MKGSLLLAVASATAASATFKLDFTKERQTAPNLRRRDDSVDVPLTQSPSLNLYWVNLTIGTPGQPFALQLDTGSSDLWIPAADSHSCRHGDCMTGAFDPTQSSTFAVVDQDSFKIVYGDQSTDSGSYVSDVVNLGTTTVQNMTFALAEVVASDGQGLLGVGYTDNEASATNGQNISRPTIIDQLKSGGQIQRAAFSLWLNDLASNTGSILFGGVDSAKYHGNLVALPISPDASAGGGTSYEEYRVDLTSISINDDAGTRALTPSDFSAPALLDSGTTLSQLPQDVLTAIYQGLGATLIAGAPFDAFVPCNYRDSTTASLTFTFGGPGGATVNVSLAELIDLPSDLGPSVGYDNGVQACGVLTSADSPDGGVILGDSFLRSAYVVYDLENNEIAIAQTNFNSTSESIQAIPSGSGLPGVSSTATATATPFAAPTAPPANPTGATASDTATGAPSPAAPTFALGSVTAGNGGATGKPKTGAAGPTAVLEPAVLFFAVFSSLAFGLGTMLVF